MRSKKIIVSSEDCALLTWFVIALICVSAVLVVSASGYALLSTIAHQQVTNNGVAVAFAAASALLAVCVFLRPIAVDAAPSGLPRVAGLNANEAMYDLAGRRYGLLGLLLQEAEMVFFPPRPIIFSGDPDPAGHGGIPAAGA